ncbi:hypothetical protein [Mesorhizobium sp. B2-3-4]|uniref:hypothetical protein n=1 Tax=Mesorhizobium sp. B2-3-4 TaxID=2589959 RepID=UPI0011263A64|nr:hypothetical protein [Mesorhizobium sp. B2-3-4]TPM41395.1 hypothetical protein FJ967_00210 [Mesorhizobium sp. B2-3-4]
MEPTTADQKISALFKALTGRFGALELKDGQNMTFVERSWQNSVGAFSWKDIQTAMRILFASWKWQRWPSEGEFMEQLRELGCRPAGAAFADRRPEGIKQAERDADIWYRGLMGKPLPAGAWPCGWADVVLDLIGSGLVENRRKTFGQLLTQAWLDGVVPNCFEAKAARYFATANERKAEYLAAIGAHGHAAVNLGRVPVR